MPTPKINLISLYFARRIKDSKNSSGVEFTLGTEDGLTLSALQRMIYINEAMFALVGTMWKYAINVDQQRNKEIFAKIFPELVRVRTITTTAGGQYVIANPNLDYFELLEAVADSKYCEIAPKHLYSAIVSGPAQYRGTAAFPKAIEIEKTITFQPVASFNAKSCSLTILVEPVDPTTGGYFTQGGTYDSPFFDHWNDEIVKIATDIFLNDSQRTS